MYYRKYYEGKTEGTISENVQVTFGASTSKNTVYINQSRIVGHAVEEVLQDAGMDAYYDDDKFILYPDKDGEFGIGIFLKTTTSLSYVVFDNESSYINTSTASSGTSYQPFDANGNYKFYVTIIGEPKGLLRVHVGTYSSPSSTSYGFCCGYGKDVRDGRKVGYLAFHPTSATTSFYVRHVDDCSLVDGIAYNATVTVNASPVSGDKKTLVLINAYFSVGYLTLDNCYLGCGALSAGATAFYLINDVEYYYPATGLLIKCPSKINN